MSFCQIFKSLFAAPVFALVCVIIGTVFSALILLINYAILVVGDFTPGQISEAVEMVARYFPIVFGVIGALSAFIRTGRSLRCSERRGGLTRKKRKSSRPKTTAC